MYQIRLDKHRSTWYWFTENPQGGGFGSNHCGTKTAALHKALWNVPAGAQYQVTTNGMRGPVETKAGA